MSNSNLGNAYGKVYIKCPHCNNEFEYFLKLNKSAGFYELTTRSISCEKCGKGILVTLNRDNLDDFFKKWFKVEKNQTERGK